MKLATRLIATGFFSGYVQPAPGTVGTAVAFFIYCFLPPVGLLAWSVFLTALFFVGVYSASVGESAWGEDPPQVVIDEFVGFFATVCFLPQSIGLGIAGFFLFRLLDILKPFPARQAEILPGGWGVVVDDLVAGIYGNLVLRGALMFWNASCL